VILVTHRLNEVLAASDRVTVLRQGRVTGRFTTAETTADELIRAMIGRSVAAPAARSGRAARPTATRVESRFHWCG